MLTAIVSNCPSYVPPEKRILSKNDPKWVQWHTPPSKGKYDESLRTQVAELAFVIIILSFFLNIGKGIQPTPPNWKPLIFEFRSVLLLLLPLLLLVLLLLFLLFLLLLLLLLLLLFLLLLLLQPGVKELDVKVSN